MQWQVCAERMRVAKQRRISPCLQSIMQRHGDALCAILVFVKANKHLPQRYAGRQR